MMKKSSKLILPLLISTIVGCGGESSVTSKEKVIEIINEDQPLVLDLGYNVTSINVSEKASHGIVTYSIENDTITYKPNENYFGTDSFQISYGNAEKKNTVSYSLTINSVNDAPVILSNAVIKREYHAIGETWEYKIKTNDIEDEGVYFNIDEKEENPNKSLIAFEFNNLELDADSASEDIILKYGDFSYNQSTQTITHVTSKVKEDYNQTAKITITDSEGLETIKDITFEIDYKNEAPEFDGVLDFNISEDESLTINVNTNTIDPEGDAYAVTINTDGLLGAIVNTDGVLEYTPPLSFFGKESFEFTITDDLGDSITKTVNISVERIINPLVVNNFNSTIDEDSTYDVQVTYTDHENIPSQDIIFSVKSNPTKGTLDMSPTGLVRYIPFANENGVDQIKINVSDNVGRSEDSVIDIIITPVNDPVVLNSNIEFSTLGNIHFSGNISSYVEDADGDAITFTAATETIYGSSLQVETNGNISFIPAVGDKNKLNNFTVEVTDGTLARKINVSVFIEDELVKIIDTDAIGSSDEGTALNPYTDIVTASADLSDGDTLYFCSNDITIAATIKIPQNASLIGFDNNNKHAFVEYCEIQSGTETKLTINDTIELQLNSNNSLENLKLNNVSSTSILTSTQSNIDNITLKNINITQVDPVAQFSYLESVNGLTIDNVIIYNGDKGLIIDKIAGDIIIEKLIVEDVNNAIEINELSSNTNLEISETTIDEFEKGIVVKNTTPLTDFNIHILKSNMESIIEDSIAIELNMSELRESNISLKDITVKADSPISITTNTSDGVGFELLNSDLLNSKGASLVIKNLDAGLNRLLIGDNTFDIVKDLDKSIVVPYIDIEQSSDTLISELFVIIRDNELNNTGSYNVNTGTAININVNSATSSILSIFDIINNSVEDTFISHVNFNFDDSVSLNDSNINIVNNDFQASNEKSLSFTEKNMISSCLNIENNKLGTIDLNNEDETSDISLYDPENEKELSIFNRQSDVNAYLPIVDYGFTFNECKTNIK